MLKQKAKAMLHDLTNSISTERMLLLPFLDGPDEKLTTKDHQRLAQTQLRKKLIRPCRPRSGIPNKEKPAIQNLIRKAL